MKKPIIRLDDLEKPGGFTTPDGYFNELPGRIQRKVQTRREEPLFARLSRVVWLRYAVPALLLVVVFFVWQGNDPAQQVKTTDLSVISRIDESHLREYLSEHEMQEEELVEAFVQHHESADLSAIDMSELSEEDLDKALDMEDVDDL